MYNTFFLTRQVYPRRKNNVFLVYMINIHKKKFQIWYYFPPRGLARPVAGPVHLFYMYLGFRGKKCQSNLRTRIENLRKWWTKYLQKKSKCFEQLLLVNNCINIPFYYYLRHVVRTSFVTRAVLLSDSDTYVFRVHMWHHNCVTLHLFDTKNFKC